MPRKPTGGEKAWTDPDDAPMLTKDFFARAEVYDDERLIRRGRPRLPNAKRQITLRLDPDVVDGPRATDQVGRPAPITL